MYEDVKCTSTYILVLEIKIWNALKIHVGMYYRITVQHFPINTA